MANPNEYLAQLVALAQAQKAAFEQFFIERSREMERLRGIKLVRLPLLIATGANPFTILPDQSQQFGGPQTPDPGYVWSLQHLAVEGLATGATPDTVNVTRQGRIVWQLNGNQFISTWGKGAMVLFQGEALGYSSVGTFAATGKIQIHGAAWQVPAEEIGKLL